ncbi:3-phosphoshikimate 1-carboxyvinyltransferase [Clostridium perfringens]|uniref:3-phosphoshikimate 1-carboxyvinyltransferase n=1 Tax=Clostridium perfringens TaxID=1502 RepID=UPI00244ABB4E|nr:3-phosphoshikimate 1-carboxyvinyltransferase [Clostridium perfringens]MDH2458891.1 3-phosphoshikimate 1-carboxyvinyltransferase [Clostridium perfringens]MDU2470141.1 3-phosphoshikimate 1-carboxyvinyltransferase [Clostridium perfringens]
MKKVIITPSKLKGSVKIPPSKSMAHRAIICASLSKGESVISNIDFSEDIIATMEGMKSLGANIKVEKDKLIINGENILKDSNYKVIDCNESGSTLRFLVPISLIKDNKVNFIGRGNLGKRPLKTYYEIFEEQEIKYSYEEEKLDLNIEGSLKGGEFKVKGNISSQFISSLLFTLPLLKEDSKIIITTELESKGYIDLTLDMIEKFGVTIKNNNYREFLIKGNQSYKPMNYKVEGDYSQAAFYFSAGALGSEINCIDLDLSSYQGDKECIEILERMGARLIESQKSSLSIIHGDLNGTIIDASQCPDIIPVLTVVAALSKGETRIINGERLRIKECDRLNAICTELNKLGADIKELKDGLIIKGVKELIGGEVYSHKDHRIAMSLAIASTRCKEEVIIKEPDCVKKSYPGFWEDFKSLGGILKGE